MMRALLGGLVLGCASFGCAESESLKEAESALSPYFAPFPAAGPLCSARRTVVYRTSGSCPNAGGWFKESVFPGALETELRRFCLYRYRGAGEPTPTAMLALPSGPKHSDCLVGTPAASQAWLVTHDAFQAQIDLTTLEPAPTKTWVAIVDSSPPSNTGEGEAVLGNNPHGFVLGRIALEAGCPHGSSVGQPCAVHVHHELALPWKFDGSTWSTPLGGGHFGYQTDVASAIFRAVNRWTTDRSAGDRLVVNLSLGWLDAFGGHHGDTDSERTSVRSAYAAIENAVCKGAVVYAAAGNRSGGTSHADGPIFPAGWAKRAKPSANRCATMFNGTVAGYDEAAALVEAVSGVDGKDEMLGNGRVGSRPRLVAPGFLGTAKDAAGGEGPVLTGSSVATVVAAAASAIAWAYTPHLNAKEIADLTYEAGQPLTEAGDAAMCFGGVCPVVRRASICGALEAACLAAPGACTPPVCVERAPYVDAQPALFQSMFPPADISIPISGFVPLAGVTPAQCGTTVALYRPEGSVGPGETPCLDRQLYNGLAHPDTGPQPTNNGCPPCTFQLTSSSVSLYIKLVAADVEDPLSSPSVLLRTNAGEFRYSLGEFGALTLNAGPSYSITGIPRDGFTSIKSATLSAVDSRGALWTAELAKAAP